MFDFEDFKDKIKLLTLLSPKFKKISINEAKFSLHSPADLVQYKQFCSSAIAKK